jgi:error-prone DNA polymerase
MVGCRGRVQRAGDVIHVVVENLVDLSRDLARVGGLDESSSLPLGRGGEAVQVGGEARDALGDITVPDVHSASIRVRTRDFR